MEIGIIIIGLLCGGFLWWRFKKNNDPISTKTASTRRSATIGISGSDVDAPIIGLPIYFEFSSDGNAFVQNPESLNYFNCNSSTIDIGPETSQITFSLSLDKPCKVKVFSMSFGFYYNEVYDPSLENIKQIPTYLYYSLNNDKFYNCNVKLLPIINLKDSEYKSLAEIFIEMPEEGLIFDSSMELSLSISKSIKDIPKICLYKIFAYELLDNIVEKDSYGSPLYPIIRKISGNFS